MHLIEKPQWPNRSTQLTQHPVLSTVHPQRLPCSSIAGGSKHLISRASIACQLPPEWSQAGEGYRVGERCHYWVEMTGQPVTNVDRVETGLICRQQSGLQFGTHLLSAALCPAYISTRRCKKSMHYRLCPPFLSLITAASTLSVY